ncbi:DUF998 domain-containing protein [Nonomuraea sp. NPDC049695]|uniref:DUF998 domain-containing protein n=1 Tax=Nonomuraea sp. NPDC049695 TaxID=3154734 RepID=UPI00342BBCB6
MTLTPSATVPRSSAVTARLSSAAILAYQILLLAAIFIKPEVDPTHKPVSEYAIGRHGWVMVLAFLMAASSYACLLAAVRPLVRGRAGRIGLAILAVCVIGTIGVGVFVADPVDTPLSDLTTRGTVHAVSGLAALVLLPFAALLITRDLARTAAGAASVLRWAAWLPLSGLVLHWLVSVVVPPEGWPPRFLFLTYALWILVLNAQILRIPRQARR